MVLQKFSSVNMLETYMDVRASLHEDLPFSRRGGEAFNPFTPEDMRVVSVAMQPR